MTATRVVILGAGGYGRLVHDLLVQRGDTSVEGFVDPDAALHGRLVNGVPVLGGEELLPELLGRGVTAAVAALGDNRLRAGLFAKLDRFGFDLPSAVHPRASVATYVRMGRGVVILAGAVINVNARLDDGVVVNAGATVDHDCWLQQHCQVWPGAHLAGNVTVGEYSYVGAGAAVIPKVYIGCNTLVGAGAAVVRDLPDNVVAVGVPARVLKAREPQ